ncbi:hypothetical protein C8R46DRAFT_1173504 [Mycena filopes]|nr:hypothetical protein C8R46DRAFT_1173504 [Mycena filopes]
MVFSNAVDDKQTRFIKVSIQNESLVHDLSVPARGSLQEDLLQLQESDQIIQEDTPAYLLTKLDDPPAEWLVIYYVPDTATVRSKMLYASSRASLLKSLGSTLFSDSIFATEREMVDVRAAERQAGGLSAYQGSRARTTHIGQTIGMPWSKDLEDAVKSLAESDDSALVIATIDLASETLVLQSSSPTVAADVGSFSPRWRMLRVLCLETRVFIYSCPSSCPVKHRMVYASGFTAAFLAAKELAPFHARKIETSTPSEIDEAYLRSELDIPSSSGQGTPGSGTSTPGGANDDEKKPFARPRGPKRR